MKDSVAHDRMMSDGESVLRDNEKLLRRCGSINAGRRLVPEMITDPDGFRKSLTPMGESGRGRVFKLTRLKPNVYYIPGFLPEVECLELTREILTQMIDNPPHSNNFGEQCCDEPMWNEYLNPNSISNRLKKLRWSCVGYHYDWGARSYDPSKFSTFPASFRKIYKSVLDTINGVDPEASLDGEAQSAIINFYHSHRASDRLGGHRDDVESNDRTPLVSISLGTPAFFLIENEVIVLRCGDALVMAEDARQSMHGVPSIITEGRKRHTPTGDRDQFAEFLSKTRISISIRQVH